MVVQSLNSFTVEKASKKTAVELLFRNEELERRKQDPERILSYYRDLGFEILLLDEGQARALSDAELMRRGPYLDLVLQRG